MGRFTHKITLFNEEKIFKKIHIGGHWGGISIRVQKIVLLVGKIAKTVEQRRLELLESGMKDDAPEINIDNVFAGLDPDDDKLKRKRRDSGKMKWVVPKPLSPSKVPRVTEAEQKVSLKFQYNI